MKFPIVPMTKRHIPNPWLMLVENAVSMPTGHADKLTLSGSVPVLNPSSLNNFAELDLRCFDSFTLTEGELRSPYVWIASVQGVRPSHSLTEDTPPSPTPSVPAYPRGSVETGVCRRPALAPVTLNTPPVRTVREARACFDTFVARTRCVTVSRLSRSPKGYGRTGTITSPN